MTDDTIRASEAPIVIECGLAATPPVNPIDTAGPEAALGSAVHDSVQAWIERGRTGEPEAQPHANQYGVDPAAVLELALAAPPALDAIHEDLTTLVAETPVRGGGVRGRIDALALVQGNDGVFAAAVADWKTGRDPVAGSKPAQRLAYASAVEAEYGMPSQGYVYTAEIWLATGDILESRFDADSIAGFRARIADRLARPTARPGPHCRYCRRLHECEPRDAYLHAGARALVALSQELPTPEALAQVWEQSRALKQALERYEAAVDAHIETAGGLDLPDGRRIEHMTVTRDHIDARAAWSTLEQYGLGADEINATLSVSKTELLKIISARAPRGKKAAAKADLMTALDVAGAIARTTSRRKKIK